MASQILIIALALCSSLFLANSHLVEVTAAEEIKKTQAFKESTKGTAKITLKAKIGQAKYVLKISVCAGNQSIQKPQILLKSDREEFVGVSKIVIPPQKCKIFSSQINSKDSATIKSILLDGKEIPKGIKVRQIL